MLAVNTMTLVLYMKGGFEPVSLQQLSDNYILMESISVSGYLPISTRLLALHMIGTSSSC